MICMYVEFIESIFDSISLLFCILFCLTWCKLYRANYPAREMNSYVCTRACVHKFRYMHAFVTARINKWRTVLSRPGSSCPVQMEMYGAWGRQGEDPNKALLQGILCTPLPPPPIDPNDNGVEQNKFRF